MIGYANDITRRFFTVHGNHDFTIRTSPQEATGFTAQWETVYDFVMRQREKDVPWGVYDGVFQEQYDWLVREALNVQGYTIIVFAHPSCDAEVDACSEKMVPIADMLRALNNRSRYSYRQDEISVEADFREATSAVAAYICGHNHGDYDHMERGLLTISTTCDASYNDDPKCRRTQGDVTEQAFDVFTIDTHAKRISTVRVGAGANRSWRYG